MKSRVAIVQARPETIGEDYARLRQLAGFPYLTEEGGGLVAASARGGDWLSGAVSPPWQVRAALPPLGTEMTEVSLVAVGSKGALAEGTRGRGWDTVLAETAVEPLSADDLVPAPYRPANPMPALESSLNQGLRFSPHLRGRTLQLLPVMGLESGGRLRGAISLLADLLAPGLQPGNRTPLAEIYAEVVSLARELFPRLAVICDATVWTVHRRGGGTDPLVRNVLVAGNDPVAVDAVLGRMAGIDTARHPWLALARDRKLGQCDPGGMELLGDTDLLDLDFQVPEDTFASGRGGWLGKWRRRPADADGATYARPGDSPWGLLFREITSGATS